MKGQQIKQNLVKLHNCNIVDIITYTLNNKIAVIQWTVMYFVWPMYYTSNFGSLQAYFILNNVYKWGQTQT